jgi:hypothetical protein
MARQHMRRSPGTLLTHACWMLCQYSRRRPLSSEKQEMAPAIRGSRGDTWAVGTVAAKEHPMVRQRHLACHGDVPPADQPGIEDRMMRGVKRVGRDPRRAGAGKADDTMDARGLELFRQGHGRQNGGEPPHQPRLTRPRGGRAGGGYGQTAGITFNFALPTRNDRGQHSAGMCWNVAGIALTALLLG